MRGSRKYDKTFCLNKNIYDLIDKGESIESLEQTVRLNNPEIMEGSNQTNGKLVKWLIQFVQQNKDGYDKRADASKLGHATKKRKRAMAN